MTLTGSSANTATNNKDNVQSQTKDSENGHQTKRFTTFTKGSAEYFTGTVRIDPLFQANDPARAVGASVTFEPGSRTVWHTHPLGQILIVTAGCGLSTALGCPGRGNSSR